MTSEMNIEERQQELIDEFAFLDDWTEKYEHIIQMGKSLSPIAEEFKTDENIIKGCQSKVWLHAELNDGLVHYTADSDAIITKGMIALILRVFSDNSPEAIISADTSFIDEIGLKEHLSPTRANGLLSMVKQIKFYALAFNSKT